MYATTSEGTGKGSVDRYIPKSYNHQVRVNNLVISKDESIPGKIDGGELRALVAGLSEEEMEVIIKAASILKKIGKQF